MVFGSALVFSDLMREMMSTLPGKGVMSPSIEIPPGEVFGNIVMDENRMGNQ